eukprot:gene9707-10737_t
MSAASQMLRFNKKWLNKKLIFPLGGRSMTTKTITTITRSSYHTTRIVQERKRRTNNAPEAGASMPDPTNLVVPWPSAITEDMDLITEEGEEIDEELLEDDESPASLSSKFMLFPLGKVQYHHSPRLPDWVFDCQHKISEHRTSPQLRRALKSWMLVKNDPDLYKKYTERSLHWYDHLPKTPPTVQIYGPEETMAYAHYFLPNRFTITKRVLDDIAKLNPYFVPKRMLDFGSGPATAAAAAVTIWPDQIKKYTALDHSKSMLDAAKLMIKDKIPDSLFLSRSSEVLQRASTNQERYDLITLTYTLTELPHDPARKAAVQMMFELLDTNGILVIIEEGNPTGSHTVRTARQMVLDTFSSVNAKGYFEYQTTAFRSKKKDLKAEDSLDSKKANPKGKEEASTVELEDEKVRLVSGRMMLPPPPSVSSYTDVKASVLAPCTHDKPCPLSAGAWCSFSQRVNSGLIRKNSEEKFSYVILKKLPVQPNAVKENKREEGTTWFISRDPKAGLDKKTGDILPLASTPKENLKWLLQQEARGLLKDGVEVVEDVDWDEYSPDTHREEWNRIVRSPIKNKGHLIFDMCTSRGNIHRYVHGRATLEDLVGFYISMRKLTWGGLIPDFMSSSIHGYADEKGRRLRYIHQKQFEGEPKKDPSLEKFSSPEKPKRIEILPKEEKVKAAKIVKKIEYQPQQVKEPPVVVKEVEEEPRMGRKRRPLIRRRPVSEQSRREDEEDDE